MYENVIQKLLIDRKNNTKCPTYFRKDGEYMMDKNIQKTL